ncbi:hypothetical protein KC909_01125 [Candidatus Dojkabacteria bacterium]|uniref:Guanylate kinase-like domain-containing protein n=1 Tax=Candidatus Dojkabacteria bacterium TaxID=2099670 RepID=A0A955L5D5_9BACT|nr:hypothetical protein [Candidatus Dojkabacteria bacterium]
MSEVLSSVWQNEWSPEQNGYSYSPVYRPDLDHHFLVEMAHAWSNGIVEMAGFLRAQTPSPYELESITAGMNSITGPTVFGIAGPGAVGKGTTMDAMIHGMGMTKFINTTTRDPRGNEVHGEDYFFMSNEDFRRINPADLLTSDFKPGRGYYGQTVQELDSCLTQSDLVVVEQNPATLVQFAQNMHRLNYPADFQLIYILPPDPMVLHLYSRLSQRVLSEPEKIEQTHDGPSINQDYLVSTMGHRQVLEFLTLKSAYDAGVQVRFLVNDDLDQLGNRLGL